MRSRKNTLTFHQKKKIITPRLIREILSWVIVTVIAVVTAGFLMFAFGMKVSVIGESMEEQLFNGDSVLVDRILSKIFSPVRGDIIVFLPNGNVNSHYYVKRIVAQSGDTVQIVDGTLYINDVPEESRVDFDKIEDAGIASNKIRLGSGEYFVLGDNRNSSEDSRSANTGVVGSNMIIGRAWFVFGGEGHETGPVLNTY